VFAATGPLGEGGTERAAAYPLPIGLTLTGVALLRLAGRPLRGPAPGDGETPASRRELREHERAERIRRAQERDDALEASAARSAADRRPADPAAPAAGTAAPGTTPPEVAEDDDFDPDDPWASPRRREA
jgi:hypothetical protein